MICRKGRTLKFGWNRKPKEKPDKLAFDLFAEAFWLRYTPHLHTTEPTVEILLTFDADLLKLFTEFKATGKSPDMWFSEQEMS